jgi:hypothetical protein
MYGDVLDTVMTNLARNVRSITVESAYGPTITIPAPFAPTQEPSQATALMKILKPRITIDVEGGAQPLVSAPYGVPGPTKWPIVSAIGIIGLGLGGWFTVRGVYDTLFAGRWQQLKRRTA